MTSTLNKTRVNKKTPSPGTPGKSAKAYKAATQRSGKAKPLSPDYGTPDEEMPQITPEQFAQALALRDRRLNAPAKQRITIMLDQDIIDFFKTAGEGYQTRINEALLRHIMRVQAVRGHPEPAQIINRLRAELNQLEETMAENK